MYAHESIPLGWLGGTQEACSVWGPVAVMLGADWFCGGPVAVRKYSGGLEVQPPEEQAWRLEQNFYFNHRKNNGQVMAKFK